MAAMAVRVELAQEIERPVGVVFRFYADDHVRNHPRWDPDIELWLDADEPIGVGTVIRRRNSRSGTPVDGTMEVVEFDRDRAFAVLTHDGPMEIRGRATFDAVTPNTTRLTLFAEIPELDEAMQGPMTEAIQRSHRRMKELIELEQ
jgi:hypothetical protein